MSHGVSVATGHLHSAFLGSFGSTVHGASRQLAHVCSLSQTNALRFRGAPAWIGENLSRAQCREAFSLDRCFFPNWTLSRRRSRRPRSLDRFCRIGKGRWCIKQIVVCQCKVYRHQQKCQPLFELLSVMLILWPSFPSHHRRRQQLPLFLVILKRLHLKQIKGTPQKAAK